MLKRSKICFIVCPILWKQENNLNFCHLTWVTVGGEKLRWKVVELYSVFLPAPFPKVIVRLCLVTYMFDWKQKLNNQWVQIEINRRQPGKPGNFFRLVSFPFQYSSAGWLPNQNPNKILRMWSEYNILCLMYIVCCTILKKLIKK